MTPDPIRLARLSDVPALVTLMSEFYAEAGFSLPADAAARTFEVLIEEPRLGRVWLLECESQPAGYVVLTVGYSMEYGGLRAFVDDLFVRRTYRGSGLATAALAEVKRACAELGVRALLVEAGPENDVALRVYRRAGFEESGRLLLTLPMDAPVHGA